MNNIAIITARGGSKRIPGKNIRLFHGLPIIAYSIRAAYDSGLFKEVMVSTDNKEIALIAKEFGASVPFLRSVKNSDDFASTEDVLIEVLEQYELSGKVFEKACCIYPTAPFISPNRLIEAHELLLNKKADSVLPVARFHFPIWRSFMITSDNTIEYNWPEYAIKRSQDLPSSFHDSGQFYFFDVPRFLQSRTLIMENTKAIELSNMEVQDIDTEEDWVIAETKYSIIEKLVKVAR